ncbi:hypothetical protein IQ221_17160 [Synechocystis salina LEGE 00041]|nr:hypothetical protein [Synechocystis salina LEGE 00041]
MPIAPVVEVPQNVSGTETKPSMGIPLDAKGKEGLTGPVLAAKLGIPPNTVKCWGNRHGQTKPTHPEIGNVPPWRYDKSSRRWHPINPEEN